MDEGQRSVWFTVYAELMAELTGQVRGRRSLREWWPSVLFLVLVGGLFALSWVSFDASVNPRPVISFRALAALLVVALGLLGAGIVLMGRSGTLGARRYSRNASLTVRERARVLALLDAADPGDTGRVAACSDLARRVVVQRGQSLINAAALLLMVELALSGQDGWFVLAGLTVAATHLVLLLLREHHVRQARRFLLAHGQRVPVPAR